MRTVRSAAAARNRRRPRLAWLLLLILLVLLALSLGEASARSLTVPEPKGEVEREAAERPWRGLDLDDLEDLEDPELEDLDLDLDDLDRANDRSDLDERDLDERSTAIDRDEIDLADHADGTEGLAIDGLTDLDLASDELAAWPATGATDARAAALARRHSRLGQIDVSLTWRRTEPTASARRDEIWLYGTWRL